MTIYFVRSTGNDSTGTGATGAPWLTIKKALTVVTSGDTLLLGGTVASPTTYAEDSGSGYLSISTAYTTARLLIATESGVPGTAIITGASAGTITQAIAFANANNVWFDGVTFQAQSSTVNIAFRFTSTAVTGVQFTRCTFTAYSASGATNLCINTGAGFTTTGIVFRDCTFNQIGPYAANGLTLTDTTGVSTGLEVRHCKFSMAGRCAQLVGMLGVKILDNEGMTWSPTTTNIAFLLGTDSTTGPACSGTISGNKFSAALSHAGIVGAGCTNVDLSNNMWRGGSDSSLGEGLVIKQNTGTRVYRDTISGGAQSGLYFKAATDAEAYECTIYNDFSTSPALRIDQDTVNAATCLRVTVKGCTFIATAGTVFGWADATGDAGGGLCDENIYILRNAATMGTIRGTAVTTLTDIRGAWAGYSNPSNDLNSKVGPKHRPFAGVPSLTMPA